MAYFDRFDICEAYACLENDWNAGGMLHERRRAFSVGVQLHRMAFKARPNLDTTTLSPNALEIYNLAAERMMLGDGGCKPCACRDCFELAIGRGAPLCHECQDAGCDHTRECLVEHDDFDGEE